MKKEELMLGDWVFNTHNRKPEQVQEIGSGLVMLDNNDLYEYDEIEPIPLTAEILEANGFRAHTEANYIMYVWAVEGRRNETIIAISIYKKPVNGVRILTKIQTDCRYDCGINEIHCCEIEYVHELQHALRLCGIDKEIIIKED